MIADRYMDNILFRIKNDAKNREIVLFGIDNDVVKQLKDKGIVINKCFTRLQNKINNSNIFDAKELDQNRNKYFLVITNYSIEVESTIEKWGYLESDFVFCKDYSLDRKKNLTIASSYGFNIDFNDKVNGKRDENNNIILLMKDDGEVIKTQRIQGLDIIFHGNNNTVIIRESTKFYNCHIHCGDFCTCFIGKTKIIKSLSIFMNLAIGSVVAISDDFSTFSTVIKCEENHNVFIGRDGMFSFDVHIWNSDGHVIFDKNDNVINRGQDVIIGDHVWLGHGVEILKGTNIGSGSLVGARSLVCGKNFPENVAIAGNPAKVIKSDIHWDRRSPISF